MGLASGRSEPNRSASVGAAVANLGHKIELTGTTSLALLVCEDADAYSNQVRNFRIAI